MSTPAMSPGFSFAKLAVYIDISMHITSEAIAYLLNCSLGTILDGFKILFVFGPLLHVYCCIFEIGNYSFNVRPSLLGRLAYSSHRVV